jgi:autotransporter-associated beta strand protein
MKKTIFAAMIAIAGTTAIKTASAQAQSPLSYSAGNIFLGFRASGGQGAANSFLFNLGNFSSLNIVGPGAPAQQVVDLGSELTTVFGDDWYTRSQVTWGIFGMTPTTREPVYSSTSDDRASAPVTKSSTQLSGTYSSYTGMGGNYNAAITSGASTGSSTGFLGNGVVTGTGIRTWAENINKAADFEVYNSTLEAGVKTDLDFYSTTGTSATKLTQYTISTSGVVSVLGDRGAVGVGGPWLWTNGTGDWSSTGNWTNGQAASNSFAVGITGGGGTITNNAVSSLSSLTFSNGAGSFTLTGTNAGQTLTISGGITNFSSNTQTIDLSIAGAGGVTQAGSGTTVLAKSNSYVGGTTLNNGAVEIRNNNALGSGTVTVSGASSLIAGVANLYTTNAMALNAATTIDTSGNRWTNGGALSGSGSLSKIGSGTLTLSGTSASYSGASTVNTGAMQVTGNLGTGTVTVNNGASLSGTGTVGAVSLKSGGILTGGVDGGVGKFTVSQDMTLFAGGILNWKFASTNGPFGTGTAGVDYDSFDVKGTLDLTSLGAGPKLQFNILSTTEGANFINSNNGEWTIVSARSIDGFNTNGFSINYGSLDLAGGAFSFSTNGSGLILNFRALGVDPWSGNLSSGFKTISSQSINSTSNAVIGANASLNGSVAVTNGGIWKVQGTLQVGGSTNGSGTLTIGSGGRIEANELKISDLRGSRGLVLITNGAASSNAISLGAGTVSFGAGNGTLQFAHTNAVTISNAISGRGTILSSGVGTTTLSGNQAGFTGTNSLSSGKVVLASGVTNGGIVNIAGRGTNVVFAMNTNSVLSSTGTHAVAGLLLDNSGMAFKDSIKGSVALAPTGVLQKTYTNGQSVAGFGAGIGAGKSFSILAGTAASNGENVPTLQAKIVNGQLDFHGTTTNAIVMSMKDPSYSTIRNQIQWYDPVSKTWKNTVAGNSGNVTNATISGMNGKSFAGSFNTFLLTAAQAGILSATEDTLLELNSLAAAELNVALAKIMGAFGYDNSTKTSWAVINHNSIFGNGSATFTNEDLLNDSVVADLSVFSLASETVTTQAVPESSTWTLMILGGLTLLFVVRAKSRERN